MVASALKNSLPKPIRRRLGNFLNAYARWNWQRRGLPAMAKGDLTIFKAVLSSAGREKLRVLEWGSGRSTVYFPKFLRSIQRAFDWRAMEFNQGWYERVTQRVAQAGLGDQVHVDFHEFIDPRLSWENHVPDYDTDPELQKYLHSPKEEGLQFDLIIVDGRLRRRCLLEAINVLAPNGIVMLHDAHRTWYHCALDSYPHVQFFMIGGAPDNSLVMCSMDNSSLIGEIFEKYGPIAAAGQ